MRAPLWPFIVIGLLLTGTSVVLFRQHSQSATLQTEIDRRHNDARERTQLLAENRQLQAASLAAKDIDALQAERDAVESLRRDLADIRRRAETNARQPANPRPAPSADWGVPESPLMKGEVAAAQWREAGAATPQAAFESVLWAAAGGDVKALADLLTLNPAARSKADDYFNGLPPALKTELGSTEQLLALLTAKDVPLGSARITGVLPTNESETKLLTQLIDVQGKKKIVSFNLRTEDGRWRLVVPPGVLAKYRANLQAPADASGPP